MSDDWTLGPLMLPERPAVTRLRAWADLIAEEFPS